MKALSALRQPLSCCLGSLGQGRPLCRILPSLLLPQHRGYRRPPYQVPLPGSSRRLEIHLGKKYLD